MLFTLNEIGKLSQKLFQIRLKKTRDMLRRCNSLSIMSGIDREIFLDPKHSPKHLPNTPQSQRLLLKGRSIHVFNDENTMLRVSQAIIERGEYTGSIRNYERYGLFFAEAIGYRISPDSSRIPLFYGEVKIDANNRYHTIPRTRPSEG